MDQSEAPTTGGRRQIIRPNSSLTVSGQFAENMNIGVHPKGRHYFRTAAASTAAVLSDMSADSVFTSQSRSSPWGNDIDDNPSGGKSTPSEPRSTGNSSGGGGGGGVPWGTDETPGVAQQKARTVAQENKARNQGHCPWGNDGPVRVTPSTRVHQRPGGNSSCPWATDNDTPREPTEQEEQ